MTTRAVGSTVGPSVTTQPSAERGGNGRTDAAPGRWAAGSAPRCRTAGRPAAAAGNRPAGSTARPSSVRPVPAAVGASPRGDEDGDSRNRRRRRRRKGKGGQEGPQGDDRDLLEVEEPISNEPVAGRRLPRHARRGLRLPPCQRLPAEPRRRLHPGQARPPVRPAQGRPDHRARSARGSQREEPGVARDPHRQRSRSRGDRGAGHASRTSPRCSPTSG